MMMDHGLKRSVINELRSKMLNEQTPILCSHEAIIDRLEQGTAYRLKNLKKFARSSHLPDKVLGEECQALG